MYKNGLNRDSKNNFYSSIYTKKQRRNNGKNMNSQGKKMSLRPDDLTKKIVRFTHQKAKSLDCLEFPVGVYILVYVQQVSIVVFHST